MTRTTNTRLITPAHAALAALACVSLSACDLKSYAEIQAEKPSKLRTVSALDCPQAHGAFKLVSTAPGAVSCLYRTDGGDELQLRLVAVQNRDPAASLGKLEAALKSDAPTPAPGARIMDLDSNEDGGSDHVNIKLPGVHIDVDERSDRANVNLPGLTVNAQEGLAEVRVNGPLATASATTSDGEGASRVRYNVGFDNSRPPRLNTLVPGSDVDTTWILAVDEDEAVSGQWQAVGYKAKGPRAGPLVAALVKSRAGGSERDLFDSELEQLIDRNVER